MVGDLEQFEIHCLSYGLTWGDLVEAKNLKTPEVTNINVHTKLDSNPFTAYGGLV